MTYDIELTVYGTNRQSANVWHASISTRYVDELRLLGSIDTTQAAQGMSTQTEGDAP
jgi:hypothetical protein